MIKQKIITGVIAVAALGFAGHAVACTPAHNIDTVVPGTLTVAVATLPPYIIISDGKLSGVDGDILKKIAEMECLKLDFKQMDFAAIIQYVNAGKADLTSSNWYGTAERLKVLGLSSPLYLDVPAILSKEGYTKFSDLDGKSVGTVQGYNWVPDLQKVFGDKLKLYPNPVALAQDLSAGRVDVGIDSPGASIYGQRVGGGYKGFQILVAEPDERIAASVESAQIVMLWKKDNTQLGDAINADIEKLNKDGDIAEILESYGLDPSAANVGEPRYL